MDKETYKEILKLHAQMKYDKWKEENPTHFERAMQNWSGIQSSAFYKKTLPLYIHESKERCQCCIQNYAF